MSLFNKNSESIDKLFRFKKEPKDKKEEINFEKETLKVLTEIRDELKTINKLFEKLKL